VSRILVVEDEPAIADFIERGLRAEGHSTAVSADTDEALRLAVADRFDLLVLDLALPGGNGLEVLRGMRGSGRDLPVIVLTGQVEEHDAVACLEEGADDYMHKPFRLEELLARVSALLRRSGIAHDSALEVGDLRLEMPARRATLGGRPLELTAREFALLHAFMRHPEQVLSRQVLLSQVWGYYFDPGTNIVAVYVSSLRKKLGQEAIETVRGMGYRLLPVHADGGGEAS
jgi:DNA-binding response OmpR family regulator